MEAKVKVVAVNPRGSIHKHNRFGNQMRCLITGVAASNASPASSVLRPASLNGGLNANPSLIAGKQIAAPAVTTIIKTVRTVGEGTRIVPSDIEKRLHSPTAVARGLRHTGNESRRCRTMCAVRVLKSGRAAQRRSIRLPALIHLRALDRSLAVHPWFRQ